MTAARQTDRPRYGRRMCTNTCKLQLQLQRQRFSL